MQTILGANGQIATELARELQRIGTDDLPCLYNETKLDSA